MAKFRKKPVVIEARQFPGFLELSPGQLASGDFTGLVDRTDSLIEFEEWLEPHAKRAGRWPCKYKGGSLIIPTLEGDHEAKTGDWIIVGVQGEIYPCKPDIFEATYEPVAALNSEPVHARNNGAVHNSCQREGFACPDAEQLGSAG